MKIEDFISFLNNFDKVFIDLPEPTNQTGELPCFERTSPFVKYSKAEFSNDSIDMYISYIENGTVYLKYDSEDEKKKLGFDFDVYNATQYMSKKIFIDTKPILNEFGIACMEEELYKAKESEIYMNHGLIGDTFPGAYYVSLDLTKVTFNHFKTGEPDFEAAAKCALDLTKMKANMKVLNWFLSSFGMEEKDDKYKRLAMDYTPEQIEFFKRNKINDFGFSPIPAYYKKTTPIDIKIGGLANLPKVEDIISRIDSNKQQTAAGSLMKPMVEQIRGLNDDKKSDILITHSELTEQIRRTQIKLREMVYNIILNKKLKSRGDITEEKKVIVDNYEITFQMNMYGD